MSYRTVVLKGEGIRKERLAAGAITPGHLLLIDSNGKYAVHATAGGDAGSIFAEENEVFGKGVTSAYSIGDQVLARHCNRGMEVAALLKASENVVIGDRLESAGDGTLRKYVVQAGTGATDIGQRQIVAIALEASNVGSVARIAVEVA